MNQPFETQQTTAHHHESFSSTENDGASASVYAQTGGLQNGKTRRDVGPQEPWRIVSADQFTSGLGLKRLFADLPAIQFFFMKDMHQNYGDTYFGFAWAGLRPLGMMIVFTVFFSMLGKLPVRVGVPFPVFVLSGMIVWQYIERVFWTSSICLSSKKHLLDQLAFSRLAAPIAIVLSRSIEFAVSTLVLGVLMVIYGIDVTAAALTFPLIALVLFLVALTLGIFAAALGARYTSTKHSGPFLIRAWFFLTPIFYDPTLIVPPQWQWAYRLNPLVSIIEAVRWSLLGYGEIQLGYLVFSCGVLCIGLVAALRYFEKTQAKLGDIL